MEPATSIKPGLLIKMPESPVDKMEKDVERKFSAINFLHSAQGMTAVNRVHYHGLLERER